MTQASHQPARSFSLGRETRPFFMGSTLILSLLRPAFFPVLYAPFPPFQVNYLADRTITTVCAASNALVPSPAPPVPLRLRFHLFAFSPHLRPVLGDTTMMLQQARGEKRALQATSGE